MAHFYGTTQGNRGETSRTGSKNSGIESEAKGWDLGGKVSMSYNSTLGADILTMYTTRGNGSTSSRVASFAIIDNKLTVLDTNYPELLI